jgi:hypothetical protein
LPRSGGRSEILGFVLEVAVVAVGLAVHVKSDGLNRRHPLMGPPVGRFLWVATCSAPSPFEAQRCDMKWRPFRA